MDTKAVGIYGGCALEGRNSDDCPFQVLTEDSQILAGTAPVSKLTNFLFKGNIAVLGLIAVYSHNNQVWVSAIETNGQRHEQSVEIGKLWHWLGEFGHFTAVRQERKTA